MSKSIIVVGAGAWGGWTAFHLQKAGFKVTLVDKNGPGNHLTGKAPIPNEFLLKRFSREIDRKSQFDV